MAERLKKLTNQRNELKARLIRFKAFCDTFNKFSSLSELKIRSKKIETTFEEFENVQREIESFFLNTEHYKPQTREREEFEALFFRIVAQSQKLISTRVKERSISAIDLNGPPSAPDESTLTLKLPSIALPRFTGTYEQWIQFRDTFQSLIHENVSLSPVQKFHYLQSALQGEAFRMLQSSGVSASNYPSAWQLLKERYENTSLMTQDHIKALFNLPIIRRDFHRQLKQMVDDTNTHVRALTVLGQPTSHWNALLVYLLFSKLDMNSKHAWEKKNISYNDVTLKEFLEFLNTRCQLLDTLNCNKTIPVSEDQANSNKKLNKVGHSSSDMVPHKIACPSCEGPHFINSCKQFLRMTPIARYNEVKRLRLCVNCLKSSHPTRMCTADHCKWCGGAHHNLLHFDKVTPTRNTSGCSACIM